MALLGQLSEDSDVDMVLTYWRMASLVEAYRSATVSMLTGSTR